MESFSETSSLISPAPIQENGPVLVASASETPDVNQSVLSLKEEIMIAEEISGSEVTIKQDEEATEEGSQHYNDVNQSVLSIKEEIMIAEEISGSEVTIKQDEEATEEGSRHYNGCLERMTATRAEASHLINSDRTTTAVTLTVNVGEKLHKCTYCRYVAATAGGLKMHITYLHDRKQFLNYRSNNCYNSAKGRSLERAVASMFEGLKLNEAGKPHNCNHCSYKGATASDLKIHIVDVHEEKKPRNRLCETAEASGSGSAVTPMYRDLKINRKENPYVCLRCRYKANKPAQSDMPYKCRLCGFEALTPVDFRAHVYDYHKAHQCTHCNYTTSSARLMKKHVMVVHKDIKPLKMYAHKSKKSHKRCCQLHRAKAAKARSLEGEVSSMLENLKLD